jgi:rhamnulokinase
MIPEYLLWRLCGVKAREYTNATSTGLVNAQTRQYDPEILHALGLPESMFPQLSVPGTVLGGLKPDIAAEVGGQTTVVLCATHDTASAVEGIPMEQGEAPFLSSGTWSLLGVKLAQPVTTPESCKANFTNEGGVGYIRYLKNIMGLWIIQCVQKQLGISFAEMVELAATSTYTRVFDVNDSRFSAPQDMRAEITAALVETGAAPVTDADLINSVYHSLAYCYGEAYREMEAVTGQHWDKLYIAGGGAKNATLNELTAQYTGKQVVALPIEATAIGNLKIQMNIQ